MITAIKSIKSRMVRKLIAIALCIPLLVSCAPIVIFWEVTLLVGSALAYTGGGQFIEQVVDELVYKLFHGDSPGYVVPDPYNSLNGTYTTKMKLVTKDPSGQTRAYTLDKPRMIRESEDSAWELAPDLKDITTQILQGGTLLPETTPPNLSP